VRKSLCECAILNHHGFIVSIDKLEEIGIAGEGASNDATLFIRLFMSHERQLRFFLYQLLPTRDDVDEVMQNTSLVLWRKFGELDDENNFINWAYVVARYEVLMYRRKKARDRLIFFPGVADNPFL